MIKITSYLLLFVVGCLLVVSLVVNPTQAANMKKTKSIVVSGQNFSFSPNKIALQKNKKVKIVFKNVEGFHDFKIEGMKVATKIIKTGEEASVSFTPNKKGAFKFYCSVGKHRAMGMQGTLTVK